ERPETSFPEPQAIESPQSRTRAPDCVARISTLLICLESPTAARLCSDGRPAGKSAALAHDLGDALCCGGNQGGNMSFRNLAIGLFLTGCAGAGREAAAPSPLLIHATHHQSMAGVQVMSGD